MTGNFLPLGTVVRLKGDTGYIMVCGRMIESVDDDGNDTVYEYAGCAFPVGVTGDDYFLFDGDDVDDIVFVGFQDERELTYQNMLTEAIEEA